MAFSLGDLFYAFILFINAVAILSEDRFLSRSMYACMLNIMFIVITVGWSTSTQQPMRAEWGGVSNGGDSVQQRFMTLVHAIRTLLRSRITQI